jgi:hypothetical protein
MQRRSPPFVITTGIVQIVGLPSDPPSRRPPGRTPSQGFPMSPSLSPNAVLRDRLLLEALEMIRYAFA